MLLWKMFNNSTRIFIRPLENYHFRMYILLGEIIRLIKGRLTSREKHTIQCVQTRMLRRTIYLSLLRRAWWLVLFPSLSTKHNPQFCTLFACSYIEHKSLMDRLNVYVEFTISSELPSLLLRFNRPRRFVLLNPLRSVQQPARWLRKTALNN